MSTSANFQHPYLPSISVIITKVRFTDWNIRLSVSDWNCYVRERVTRTCIWQDKTCYVLVWVQLCFQASLLLFVSWSGICCGGLVGIKRSRFIYLLFSLAGVQVLGRFRRKWRLLKRYLISGSLSLTIVFFMALSSLHQTNATDIILLIFFESIFITYILKFL